MHFSKLGRGELIASLSGVVLGVSLFLHWYSTNDNPNSKINGVHPALVSAWDVFSILRYPLLLAALAPLILAYIVIRDHKLSWPRGEVTALVSVTALVLVLVVGFLSRPGDPRATISLQPGWFVAFVATVGMLVGAAQRTSVSGGQPRKPPGVF